MIISLIGYMASGKTTLGKALSNELNYQFIDLDEYIETKEKMHIVKIFKNKGEIYFRRMENKYLKEVLEKENIVLATGGGTPIFYDNIEIINKHSSSFLLQLSPVNLAERLIKEKYNRPLISHLKDEDMLEFVAKHLFERNPFYQKSQFAINCNGKSISEIIFDITKEIKNHQNQP